MVHSVNNRCMRRAIIRGYGGPEKIIIEETPTPQPGVGEVRVRVEAAGVNYIDTYHRGGLYPMPLPVPLGLEGAGRIEAVGPGVDEFKVGDRVAWSDTKGSYATHVVASADRLVPVPEGVELKTAAAAMLQGMTAHYLSHSIFALKAGDTCLIHAAAGGLGLLLCQMARRAGARVIGTTSTPEKAELARKAGAGDVILYRETSVPEEVRRLTGGRGVDVVYDGVGKDTFEGSVDALRPRGMMVLFGQSSGVVPPVDLGLFGRKGSLFFTRPSLLNYTTTREELLQRAGDVLSAICQGELSIAIHQTLPLDQAAEAHRLLESRGTTGKLLLVN